MDPERRLPSQLDIKCQADDNRADQQHRRHDWPITDIVAAKTQFTDRAGLGDFKISAKY